MVYLDIPVRLKRAKFARSSSDTVGDHGQPLSNERDHQTQTYKKLQKYQYQRVILGYRGVVLVFFFYHALAQIMHF